MATAQIISNYSSQYQNPIVLKKGDTVKLGKEEMEEKWRGWIWAENETNAGWVPIQILRISEDRNTAILLEDYSAKELDVEEGDMITVTQHLNGWVLAKHQTTEEIGWIPDENVRFL